MKLGGRQSTLARVVAGGVLIAGIAGWAWLWLHPPVEGDYYSPMFGCMCGGDARLLLEDGSVIKTMSGGCSDGQVSVVGTYTRLPGRQIRIAVRRPRGAPQLYTADVRWRGIYWDWQLPEPDRYYWNLRKLLSPKYYMASPGGTSPPPARPSR